MLIFADVGAKYGYGDVGAEFAALEDFKIRWQRSYDWSRFTVSDYLGRAPERPMRGRKAERQVTDRFGETAISHLGYYRPGSNAANYYEERKSKWTLPVAVRPLRKKRSDTTTV